MLARLNDNISDGVRDQRSAIATARMLVFVMQEVKDLRADESHAYLAAALGKLLKKFDIELAEFDAYLQDDGE